jgi:hypothetical protein
VRRCWECYKPFVRFGDWSLAWPGKEHRDFITGGLPQRVKRVPEITGSSGRLCVGFHNMRNQAKQGTTGHHVFWTRYEHLSKEPLAEAQRICAFLGMEHDTATVAKCVELKCGYTHVRPRIHPIGVVG